MIILLRRGLIKYSPQAELKALWKLMLKFMNKQKNNQIIHFI